MWREVLGKTLLKSAIGRNRSKERGNIFFPIFFFFFIIFCFFWATFWKLGSYKHEINLKSTYPFTWGKPIGVTANKTSKIHLIIIFLESAQFCYWHPESADCFDRKDSDNKIQWLISLKLTGFFRAVWIWSLQIEIGILRIWKLLSDLCYPTIAFSVTMVGKIWSPNFIFGMKFELTQFRAIPKYHIDLAYKSVTRVKLGSAFTHNSFQF